MGECPSVSLRRALPRDGSDGLSSVPAAEGRDSHVAAAVGPEEIAAADQLALQNCALERHGLESPRRQDGALEQAAGGRGRERQGGWSLVGHPSGRTEREEVGQASGQVAALKGDFGGVRREQMIGAGRRVD